MGREWYENNKEYQKANAKKHMTEYRQNLREFVYEYLLTHPCVGPDGKGCPYNEKDPAVLEFHHVGEKTADVAVIVGRGSSLERLKAEIENCVVVCRNCHARITAQERGFFRK
jgi:hypothetical protein